MINEQHEGAGSKSGLCRVTHRQTAQALTILPCYRMSHLYSYLLSYVPLINAVGGFQSGVNGESCMFLNLHVGRMEMFANETQRQG